MILEPLIPKVKRRKDGKGRLRRDAREVLNGILWILISGSPWYLLPREYPPYQTCHRYFQRWVRKGVIQKILRALSSLHGRGRKQKDVDAVDGSLPQWCKEAVVKINGATYQKALGDTIMKIDRTWKTVDVVELLLPMHLFKNA